jgi:hypothetical protein
MVGQIKILKRDEEGTLLYDWRIKGIYGWFFYLDYRGGYEIFAGNNGGYLTLKPTIKAVKRLLSVVNVPVDVVTFHDERLLFRHRPKTMCGEAEKEQDNGK